MGSPVGSGQGFACCPLTLSCCQRRNGGTAMNQGLPRCFLGPPWVNLVWKRHGQQGRGGGYWLNGCTDPPPRSISSSGSCSEISTSRNEQCLKPVKCIIIILPIIGADDFIGRFYLCSMGGTLISVAPTSCSSNAPATIFKRGDADTRDVLEAAGAQ